MCPRYDSSPTPGVSPNLHVEETLTGTCAEQDGSLDANHAISLGRCFEADQKWDREDMRLDWLDKCGRRGRRYFETRSENLSVSRER